jgi:alpha-ketoglutarate-dependent taurine dioxygenase
MLRFQPQPVTGQQRHADAVFPLVFEGDGPVSQQDLRAQSAMLMEQLATHGAILFRDCGVTDAQAFDDFVAGFGLPNFPYGESLSNAVRHNRTPRVFTANEAPQDVEIFLHHEMAQTPYFPSHLFFYCEQAAAAGGATPLCRSDVLLEKLTQHLPEFVARCRAHGRALLPHHARRGRRHLGAGQKLAPDAECRREGGGRVALGSARV